MSAERSRATSLSPPARFMLNQWGRTLRESFGAMPYLVGSVARAETFWRDVDVRVMLDADEFQWLDYPPRLAAVNSALSVWGQLTTGLPIDFQFQKVDDANADYGNQVRVPVGMSGVIEAPRTLSDEEAQGLREAWRGDPEWPGRAPISR